jgi:ribosomal protein L25 (general stress protein Ctc)
LKASLRDKTGKERSKRFRGEGYVPGVMYGHGEDALSIAIEKKA